MLRQPSGGAGLEAAELLRSAATSHTGPLRAGDTRATRRGRFEPCQERALLCSRDAPSTPQPGLRAQALTGPPGQMQHPRGRQR